MQIIEKDPLQPNGPPQTSLVEIGPRFVLTPIRIFEGAFSGATVFSNPGTSLFLFLFPFLPLSPKSIVLPSPPFNMCFCPNILLTLTIVVSSRVEFVSPTVVRTAMRREKGERYKDRRQAKEERTDRKVARALPEDELAVSKVFA